ncbi:MAG TPA: cyclic 2,3-diphosphoglycerate synthase, partial [Candidatus Bathyarchaeia archaeon]|nr:cyclic 2,3-diphosphoglycerate synthase [Candidatus Bathyarchaeia archaeon]
MKRVIIMGAAGRDFHNFNVAYRKSPDTRVVAFTATQIPGIEGRTYPPELAGPHYPKGIRIYSEEDLPRLVKELKADIAVLSYSDISYLDVMHKASIAMAAGADFELLGPHSTTLKSKRPVVSVCAVRTGAGKSTVSRRIASILKSHGKKVAIIRHPMPYGNLLKEASQRFATLEDLDKADCSIEEREEYEPHIANGFVVFAGVDYQKILEAAEKEADVILWDGGNNDIPFIQPDVHLVVLDPLRPGNELDHYPSEINVRLANAGIINKVDTAEPENVQMVETNLKKLAPNAIAIEAVTEITLDKPELVQGKRVLVIEDGPTVTHGDMTFGVGLVAAKRFHASEIVDPRKSAVGIYKDTFRKYYHLTQVLPTMGYGKQQVRDLQDTIARTDCD